MNDYGQVYIIVKYSENSTIGKRGFTEEEKKKGLILIFNQKNYKDLQWAEDGSIIATLGFGGNNRLGKCFLHCDDIVSVFSPDARIKFDRWDVWVTGDSQNEPRSSVIPKEEESSERKIISLNSFKKNKK